MKNNGKERELLDALQMENFLLQANTQLGNELECLRIQHRIADIKITLLVLSGDLPLTALTTKP